jgi:hypothetical protein
MEPKGVMQTPNINQPELLEVLTLSCSVVFCVACLRTACSADSFLKMPRRSAYSEYDSTIDINAN